MTPYGAAPLIALRTQGKRPVNAVWINYGDEPAQDWWKWAETCGMPVLTIRTTDPIDRLDLRCLIGLAVVLHFADWTERVARLLERVQEMSPEIAVISPSFEDDVGFWLIRGEGQFPIDQYPQRRAA